MSLKRGIVRTTVIVASFVFAVGVVWGSLIEGLLNAFVPWSRGIAGIFLAGGVVLAAILALRWILPGLLGRIVRWVVQGFREPAA